MQPCLKPMFSYTSQQITFFIKSGISDVVTERIPADMAEYVTQASGSKALTE